MMTNDEAERFMREHFLFIKVPMVPVKVVTYFTKCYGCDAIILDGEGWHGKPDICSEKCYCEISSIP